MSKKDPLEELRKNDSVDSYDYKEFGLLDLTAQELLSILKKEFPDRLPSKVISEPEMGRLIGQQDIIDFIERNIERRQ